MLVPNIYQVQSIIHETHDTFTLVLECPGKHIEHHFLPGQFNMLYPFGIGEAAISLSGNPKETQRISHTVRAIGSVTKSLQKLQPGDEIGVRGPFGSHWPLEKKNCDVLVIAGGVGLAPLRSAMYALAEKPQDYGKISLVYGARTANDIVFKKDLETWKALGFDVEITLDYADTNWKGNVGVVTSLIHKHVPNPGNTLALICGPEIMIKFALNELMGVGTDENNIYVAMERNMQCALGFCGHCLYGPVFICKDGPIFCYPQIKDLLPIKEL